MQLDPVTKAVIDVTRGAGYGETWTVSADEPYRAVVELARQVGIELEDG